MFKKLFAVLGLARKKPLLCKKWLSFEQAELVQKELASATLHSALVTGAPPLSSDSPLVKVLKEHLAAGKGLLVVDSLERPWLPALTELVHELDRDADVEVLAADESGLYPPNLSAMREKSKVLVINPPVQPPQGSLARERTLSNLLVELLFDAEQPGYRSPTYVLVNELAFGLRDSLLSSMVKQSAVLPYQLLVYIADVHLLSKNSPKLMHHLALNVDACISPKKRKLFTTESKAAEPAETSTYIARP